MCPQGNKAGEGLAGMSSEEWLRTLGLSHLEKEAEERPHGSP